MHTSNVLILKAFLKQKNIIFEDIDGALSENKNIRNVLFDEAVKQGGTREYPSAFVMREDKSVTYIGNWNRIQELLDAESIDKAILEAHPEIVTFSSFFK